MKTRSLIILALLVASIVAMAVPAERTKKNVTLTDGSVVTVTMCGDEHLSYAVTDDGQTLLPTDDGRYAPVSLAEFQSRNRAAMRRIGSREKAPIKSIGEVHVPIVLVQFADRSFMQTDPKMLQQEFDRHFNDTDYTEGGNVSSVAEYFRYESDGQFNPIFDIYGPVTLSKGYAYYGRNTGGVIDANFEEFCFDALSGLEKDYINWQHYDNGGNGLVDMVFFVFAGRGENSSHESDDIWPKEKTISMTVGDIVFETSAVCPEARTVKSELKQDGIGVKVHELMHALGMPDFYDTRSGSAPVYGMDLFSIMDYGEYNNYSYSPTGLTAYERDFLGWRPLTTINTAGTYALQPSGATGATGYKVVNDLNPDEYYVLEYRDNVGNDQFLSRYAAGMTVTHVDYNAQRWNNNTINTEPAHQRVTLLPAAGDRIGVGWVNSSTQQTYYADLAHVPFPGEGKVDSLTNHNPVYPATTFTGGFMSKPIYNICHDATAQTVTFDFLVPSEATPITAPASTSSAAEWKTLDGLTLMREPQQPGIYVRKGQKIIKK